MVKYSHLDIGQIGEESTIEHYKKHGYTLLTKNYWKPFGEIDVVVEKGGELVFIEVKSVSCISFDNLDATLNPAENIHYKKRARLRKVIVTYLKERESAYSLWRFDVAIVHVNTKLRRSRVEVIEDVVL